MTNLACAVCVLESTGAGRPPAVTIHEGTALCVEHLIERNRPAIDADQDRAVIADRLRRLAGEHYDADFLHEVADRIHP